MVYHVAVLKPQELFGQRPGRIARQLAVQPTQQGSCAQPRWAVRPFPVASPRIEPPSLVKAKNSCRSTGSMVSSASSRISPFCLSGPWQETQWVSITPNAWSCSWVAFSSNAESSAFAATCPASAVTTAAPATLKAKGRCKNIVEAESMFLVETERRASFGWFGNCVRAFRKFLFREVCDFSISKPSAFQPRQKFKLEQQVPPPSRFPICNLEHTPPRSGQLLTNREFTRDLLAQSPVRRHRASETTRPLHRQALPC